MKKAIFILMSLLLLAGCKKDDECVKQYFQDEQTEITEDMLKSAFGISEDGSGYTYWSSIDLEDSFRYYKDKDGCYYYTYPKRKWDGSLSEYVPYNYPITIDSKGCVTWKSTSSSITGKQPISFTRIDGTLYVFFPYLNLGHLERTDNTLLIPSSLFKPVSIDQFKIVMDKVNTDGEYYFTRVTLHHDLTK